MDRRSVPLLHPTATPPSSYWTDSFAESATQEHCPTCRGVSPDIVAARVRFGAALLFARQLRLELDELADLLHVVRPDAAS